MKYLIINGDDFGLSQSVNSALIKAHRDGILTSASLMLNEPGFREAVGLARENPELGVGIHLALIQGHSSLPPYEIKPLVNQKGEFDSNPVLAGLRFFFIRKYRNLLQEEITAQIEKFFNAGIKPTHIDGHLNIHLHPSVLMILLPLMDEFKIQAVRVPSEDFFYHWKLDRSKTPWKAAHALIFKFLGAYATGKFRTKKIQYPHRTFGLLQSGNMTREFVTRVLANLPDGITEMSFHVADKVPSSQIAPAGYHYEEEFRTLIDPELKELVQKEKIQLINYSFLTNH